MGENEKLKNEKFEIKIKTQQSSVKTVEGAEFVGQKGQEKIMDNNKGLSADVEGDETKENEENKTQEDEEKNEEKNKEKNEEKNEDPKVVNTPWGFLLTQLFGTFGPVLGALSGPVGLLLIVYVLPKTTKLKLPNIKLNKVHTTTIFTAATSLSLTKLSSSFFSTFLLKGL